MPGRSEAVARAEAEAAGRIEARALAIVAQLLSDGLTLTPTLMRSAVEAATFEEHVINGEPGAPTPRGLLQWKPTEKESYASHH